MQRTMKTSSRILSFFVALIMMSFVCLDSSFAIKAGASAVISAQSIIEDMGLGWNLGNSLDSTGSNGADAQETSWGNPRVTESLIKAVKAKGFNTVRIPTSWYPNITENGGKYTIEPTWFARVKEVVDYAYNNGMYVIINVHHENWVNRSDLATSYKSVSAELKQVWTQIAEYFADYDQHLIFEGMNEPRMVGAKDEWTGNSACYEVINKLNADFIGTVRSVDSKYKTTRLLMVPGYAASGDYGIYSNLDKSLFNDPYVAASVHAYKPFDFAMGKGDHSSFSADNKAELDSVFGNLRSFFTQNNIPVVIGEFSASNYGYTDARVDWAEYYMTIAKETGIACVLWDNNAISNSDDPSEAHGYINRSNNTWYSASEPVVNKLISVRNDDSIVWASKASYPMYAHNNYSGGTAVSVNNDGNMAVSDLKNFKSGKEFAVKYTTETAPTFALMNSGWDGWTELSAYDFSYSDSGNIAYLRYDDIYKVWDSSANGELAYVKISNYKDITVSGVRLLDVNTSSAHKHSLADTYSYDASGHWFKCSGCDEKVKFAKHTEDNGTITTQPTETTEGEKVYKCAVCGYVIRTEPIAKLDHKHVLDTNWTSDASGHWHNCTGCSEKVDFAAHTEDSGTITKQPTMTEEGEKTYKCKVCKYVIRTESIPTLAEKAVAVSDGTEINTFDDLTAALNAYKKSTANLTITLNKDANVKKLSLPTKASGITFEGTGRLELNMTSLTVPANTTFNIEVNGTNARPLAIRVSAGKTLDINGRTSNIGAVNGAKTSTLNINEDIEITSIATFGSVNVDSGKTLTVTSKLSAVTSLNGTVKLPTAKTTAATVTAGNAEIILVEGNIAKVTLADVTEKVNVKVVDENDEAVKLSSGTVVLYSTKDISEKVTVENTTDDGKELNAFFYKKNKAIKAEWADAVTLSYGGTHRQFPNVELALEEIKDKNTDYTLTLNTSVTEPKFVLPKTAKSITINGTGTLTTAVTSIAAPVDTTIGCTIKHSADKAIALRAAAKTTLTLSAENTFGAVSGARTSVLNVNENIETASIATFGSVNIAEEKVLTVSGKLSAVSSLNGAVKLPTVKTTAATVTAGNAEIILVENNIAKVTLADITTTVNVRVVDENNDTVDLASGTVVLYSTKDISEKVTVENTTDGGKELNAFFYKKNKAIKAEWADAVTLSYGETSRKFPNTELALEAINDKTKTVDYTLTLNTNLNASALALPAYAKSVRITSTDETRAIDLTNVTTISAKTPLTLENVRIESTKPFTISTTSDLMLENFVSDSIAAVRGGTKAVLELGTTSPIDKVSGFGTIKLSGEFRTGSTFTTTALELTETADLIVSNTKAAASAKTLKGAEGSVITLDSGFTPIKVTGTTADSISGAIKLRANEEVTDTTILFAAKYAGNNVFDVTEIQPDGKECVVTSISGKAYMKPIVFEFSGERYALWTDVMTVIENVKMSEAAYTVTLLDDVNVNGALKLPRTGTYRKLTITSDSKTLSFTGNITATGELEIMNTNLDAVKNNVSCKYTISAGRNPFTSENSDLGLAGISGTADTTLKNTAMSGAVRAGKLTLNGTDTILGTITATELCSDEDGTVLNVLAKARGVMSITKNGIPESSEDITIKLIDSDKNAVPAANKAVIASNFKGSYNGQLILSDENGVYSIVLVKGKLILADNATIAANSFDDIADDIDADLPDDETDEDDTDGDTSEEETSDDSSDDDTAEDNENTEDDANDVPEEETEDGSEQNEGDADTSDDMSA